jgi:hypothetical protein
MHGLTWPKLVELGAPKMESIVAILLYVDDVVMLSRSGACLQRLLNKLYEFSTSSSLEVNQAKSKIMVFGHNKWRLN